MVDRREEIARGRELGLPDDAIFEALEDEANRFHLDAAIPDPNWRDLMKRIKHLNKRASKLGTDPLELTVHRVEDRIMNENTGEIMRFHHITLDGEVPVIEGWLLIAVLDHQFDEANMIRRVPVPAGLEIEIDEKWRTADPDCDHCSHRRNRTETFLLWKDGEWRQVGRTCLKDFGANKWLVRRLEWLEHFYEAVSTATEIYDIYTPRGEQLLDTLTYLTHVAAVIEHRGWMSRSKARESGDPATADVAFANIDEASKSNDYFKASEEWIDRAEAALEWARTELPQLDPMSDYEWNLALACESEIMRYKDSGIIASLIPTFCYRTGIWTVNGENGKDQPVSDWVGEVGQRREFDLTVEASIPVDTEYGRSDLYLMVDADGNVFKWFTTSWPIKQKHVDAFEGFFEHPDWNFDEWPLDVGWTYRLKGTIKAHETYRNVKQTALSRCNVVKIISMPENSEEN